MRWLRQHSYLNPLQLSCGVRRPFTVSDQFQLVSERWPAIVWRNGAITILVGAAVALSRRDPSSFVTGAVIALWFTFGGHAVELLFRNRLRPWLPGHRATLAGARLVTWFVGGSVLFAGAMAVGALVTGRRLVPWPWWAGALAFLGLELLVHSVLTLRHQPSFYNGRG